MAVSVIVVTTDLKEGTMGLSVDAELMGGGEGEGGEGEQKRVEGCCAATWCCPRHMALQTM